MSENHSSAREPSLTASRQGSGDTWWTIWRDSDILASFADRDAAEQEARATSERTGQITVRDDRGSIVWTPNWRAAGS